MDFDYCFDSYWFHSPGYLLADVPECVKTELMDSLNELHKNDPEKQRNNQRTHIEKEYYLPITSNLKLMVESMSFQYEKIFGVDNTNGSTDMLPKKRGYEVKQLWVNYSKKHEFVPVHWHSGVYSFVIWVNVPYIISEEQQRYENTNNEVGVFYFRYNTAIGGSSVISIPADKTWEWKLIFFPAKLDHGVNPFYTSDEYRVSIAGNIYVKDIAQ